MSNLLDAVPSPVLLLNSARQVVFANRAAQHVLGSVTVDRIYGLRPGDALDCTHASEHADGCGHAAGCMICGAAGAITTAEMGVAAVAECRITESQTGRARDLRVAANPYTLNGESFVVVTLVDIADQKRRLALERLFFHDLLNTLGGLTGCAGMLPEATPREQVELSQVLINGILDMSEQIRTHRDLLAAENGDLTVDCEPVIARDILTDTARRYRNHEAAHERLIVVGSDAPGIEFLSDRTLLGRVLGNMLNNALEATAPGDAVTLACTATAGEVTFRVHNPGVIAERVQLQIFQRSFSTKGSGRGLGTYSIKLLTERYLGGRAWFTSTHTEGTTFFAAFPRSR